MISSQLERDLRAARHEFDDVSVSSDAWQQNQRRVAAARGRRGRPLLVVAAALVLVVLVGGAVLLGGGPGGSDGMPASGDDPFGDSVILGPPVEVESVPMDGVQTTHEAVLSDSTGKGPSLCDRYVGGTGFSGGCTSRDPNADDPAVAIDWLTGTTGSGDIRGVLAGVDSRVLKVQIWMDNGDETLAVLKPGGWAGTKLFGFTVPADGPRPQRLVAYSDASGTVLQAVDLSDRFGDTWLPAPEDVCPAEGARIASLVPLDAIAGPSQAHVVAKADDGNTHDACFPVRAQIQGADAGPRTIVLVVAPEVAEVRLGSGQSTMLAMAPLQPIPGSLWQVAVITLADDLDPSDTVLAFDRTQHLLDVLPLGSLS